MPPFSVACPSFWVALGGWRASQQAPWRERILRCRGIVSRAAVTALACAVASAAGRAAALSDGVTAAAAAVAALAAVLCIGGFTLLWQVRRRGDRRRAMLVSLALGLPLFLSLIHGWVGGVPLRPPELDWDEEGEAAGWLAGRVASEPRPAQGGVRLVLDVEDSTLPLPESFRTSLWVDSAAGTPRFTSRILAFAELRDPGRPTTPGGFDQRQWLASQGAALAGRVRAAAWRELSPPPPGLVRPLLALRGRWSQRISARLPGPAGEFLRGLVLGERGHVSPEIIDDFRRAGVLHLLALSGQHVALVAMLLIGFCRLLGLGVRREAVVSALGVWAYAVLTGLSPSVTRAALGASLHLVARYVGRRSLGIEVLAWSAALPVLCSPRLGLHVGFQLSCLASAGIMAGAALERGFFEWLQARRLATGAIDVGETNGNRLGDRMTRWLRQIASLPAVTASAQIAVLPLLAGAFGAVSAVGLVSNLFMVPACVVLLSTALPLVILDSMIPTPAFLWRAVAALAAVALRAGEGFAALPGARLACSLSPWSAALAAVAALVAGLGWRWIATRNRRGGGPAAGPHVAAASCAAVGTWLGLVVIGLSPQPLSRDAVLHYWMLDVGQGDCQVLEFADGRVLVVDVGASRPGYDAASRVLAPFLRVRGWRRVDRVLITHEDGDHAGGWPALPGELGVSDLASGRETLMALAAAGSPTRWHGTTTVVARGDTLMRGPGYLVRVLWPPPGITGLAPNQRSVVLQVEVGAERLILPGDADSTTERQWVGAVSAPVTVLKLGHHGAASSTGNILLRAIGPRLALASCGRRNRFGHPHPATLERLQLAGIALRRTDREGSVHLVFGRRHNSRHPTPRRLTYRP